MNERATAQLRVIRAVVDALGAAGISAWLFGGWGLDARIGRITREQVGRLFSFRGDGRTGCSRQAPSAMNRGYSMARRYWP